MSDNDAAKEVAVTTEGDATPESSTAYPSGDIGLLYKECDEYNSPAAIKKRNSNHFWKVFGDIVFTIIMGVLCYAIVMVNLTKQNGQIPFIAGYSLEYVETGSMEPTLPTGCVILAKQKDNNTVVNVGDIITFYEGYDRSTEAPSNRVRVTHRLYAETIADDGTIWYTTKGDNNNAPDQYQILYEDIIATFVRRLF